MTNTIERYTKVYQRVGGGQFTVTRLLRDGLFYNEAGQEFPFVAGDMLITSLGVTPATQWAIEGDVWKQFYEPVEVDDEKATQ